MVAAVSIEAMLAGRTVLRGRTGETPESEVAKAFATLASFGDGGVFAGSFSGDSSWERHTKGDELVHILEGQTTLTVLTDEGRQTLDLTAGMLTVVPQACWHRFHAPDGVTVLTVTPRPTEFSNAEDPRHDD
jgi:uncharacterized cupin superfamily protein